MKRTMSRVTAIVAMVFAILGLLGSLAISIAAYWIARQTWWDMWGGWSSFNTGLFVALLVTGIIILALTIVQIVLCAKLLGRTNDPTKTPADFNGLLIGVTIMCFFVGGWIPLALGIIALCANNAEDAVEAVAAAGTSGAAKGRVGKTSEFDQAVARLKQYKEDGIIDEATYKKKMDELFQKHYM